MPPVETICVCGAGTMGTGIAQAAAQKGLHVLLYDVNNDVLNKSRIIIENNIDRLRAKGKLSSGESHEIIGRLQYITDINDCIAQIIIEAIVEKYEPKIELFSYLAKINHHTSIFASNTSSLSITAIAQQVTNPGNLAGMHFFNPAPIMQLVEIATTEYTTPATAKQIYNLAVQMGKTPVYCKDAPGFIVNRVARHYYLEALRLVEEANIDFTDVDAIMEASGFKMGPFRLMDLIGNDVNLAVTTSLYEAFNHSPRFSPSPLQIEKVQKHELGKKTGKGYYDYNR